MGAAAGFHAHRHGAAGRTTLLVLIKAVNLNYVLCQIHTYGRNLHLERSPSFVVVGLALSTLAHSMPL
jgi:hypothetical protein